MDSRRITLIANEIRGLYPAGGMGTATTFLALALARMGHAVELLVAWQPERPLDQYWERTYADAGVRVRRTEASAERVTPTHFEMPRAVDLALRNEPPDVLVATDLNAPAYCALRLRQAGLAFGETLFVVFCHGTRRWILEMSRRLAVKDLRSVLATNVLERASLELADVVVSPSSYLVSWMREQRWTLPERTLVIPYFTRSGATGEPPPTAPRGPATGVQRLAFFGRLEDKKGIGTFLAGVNELDPALLRRITLDFIGKPTASWTPDRIAGALSERSKGALRDLSFSADLDQPEALAQLRRPGTVAVIPSLGDNSPNTIYECLEQGIPFLASAVGGIPELIAEEDRAHVLFPPTVEGVREALARTISDEHPHDRVRAAFTPEASESAWSDLVHWTPRERPGATSAPTTVFVREGDRADEQLVPLLSRAQAATGAAAVTCAARVVDADGTETLHFFSGEPGGLGALANDYGIAAVLRHDVLDDDALHWPLLARIAARGERLVSLPLPLVTSQAAPETVETHPQEALLVAQELERTLPRAASSLARLATGLAATTSAQSAREPSVRRWRSRARSFVRRARGAMRGSPR